MAKEVRDSGATRANQWRNQSRAVHQVVRLLTAGARIDELSLGDVLELLRLRGDRREGLSRATYYRWIRRADRGDLSARDLEEWLKIHEPYALGTARLTQLASVEDSYELPMRLWVGVAPSSFDVVLAELKVLRAAHLRGGRPDAAVRAGEFMAFVEEMSSGGRTISTSRFPSFAGFLTSRASDSTKVFDGVRIAVNGVEASVQTASYRAVTEAYSSALDGEAGEPFTPSWALRQLRDEPTISDRANLIGTAAGRAAIIERALLTHEMSEDKHALAATSRLLREMLPHLDYPEGFNDQRDDQGSSWSVFHWEALCLRARAWASANAR